MKRAQISRLSERTATTPKAKPRVVALATNPINAGPSKIPE
ncbi:hypothetical protein ABS858_08045 [Vibrio neptunius]